MEKLGTHPRAPRRLPVLLAVEMLLALSAGAAAQDACYPDCGHEGACGEGSLGPTPAVEWYPDRVLDRAGKDGSWRGVPAEQTWPGVMTLDVTNASPAQWQALHVRLKPATVTEGLKYRGLWEAIYFWLDFADGSPGPITGQACSRARTGTDELGDYTQFVFEENYRLEMGCDFWDRRPWWPSGPDYSDNDGRFRVHEDYPQPGQALVRLEYFWCSAGLTAWYFGEGLFEASGKLQGHMGEERILTAPPLTASIDAGQGVGCSQSPFRYIADASGEALDFMFPSAGLAPGQVGQFSFYIAGNSPAAVEIWADGAADANSDGRADFMDLGRLATNYGRTGRTWRDGDFTGDRKVDHLDLGILATHYNQQYDPPKVAVGIPEPTTALLLLAAPTCLLRRRRA